MRTRSAAFTFCKKECHHTSSALLHKQHVPRDKGFFRPDEVIVDYLSKLNDPGAFPFTRGIYPTMYRGKKPTIRQFAGFGLAPDTNERFMKILALGGAGLSTAFDLPTLMGADSDEPISECQVGWDGVALDTLRDMEDLFKDIPVGDITVSMTINAPAAILLAMYIAMAEKRGIPRAALGGTIQNDILKEYIAQKEWAFPVDKGVKLVVDTMEFCAREMPKWHPVSISGYHIREAGASAVQEVAFTLADGIAYVEGAIRRGMPVDSFAPQLSFFFDVHNNFFEEIAKLRAARRLWAGIMRERFASKDPRSQWLRMHAQTAGCSLTLKEPINNVIRVAYQALAALLGGAQSIHTNSFDEVVCVPTERALKIAIRTQQILLEETEIPNWCDPLGGSWLVERLTDDIEDAARREIAHIDSLGGIEAAIALRYPQSAIVREAIRDQKCVEAGERKIVGVNSHPGDDYFEGADFAEILEETKAWDTFEERQIARLGQVKRERSSADVARALLEVRRAAGSGENMMPALIAAVKIYATVGEITKALQGAWGSYREPEIQATGAGVDIGQIANGLHFRRPVRILIAKGGFDGHTRGLGIFTHLLRELGAEVIYMGLHRSVTEVAQVAIDEDVDAIGFSALIGSPVRFFTKLKTELTRMGRSDIFITGGGIVRPREKKFLEEELHIGRIFLPDTPLREVAKYLVENIG
ncbi:MAG: hypothetical protein A2676_01360 [Candidatus Sungbacteria bacterium RIFCSPHIGHO2_01_FULL_51_22]|nr:MAG: hypothetical protein A2676_01360 [Candidatus Sungbacteria bacterium RIFCSPHIGHO2_01_FULL_51_22]